MEAPVALFRLSLPEDASEDDHENIREFLKQLFTFKNKADSNDIYIYPQGLTAY